MSVVLFPGTERQTGSTSHSPRPSFVHSRVSKDEGLIVTWARYVQGIKQGTFKEQEIKIKKSLFNRVGFVREGEEPCRSGNVKREKEDQNWREAVEDKGEPVVERKVVT